MLKYFYRVAIEVIVSWTEAEALKDANSLRCFSRIKEAVIVESHFFNSLYGTVPDFKAAIHIGSVATGEIG